MKAKQALERAFGQIYNTPDGRLCMWGRIDRVYDIIQNNPGDERYPQALAMLQAQLSADLAMYRQALEDGEEVDVPQCQCAYCQRQPTINGEKI